ncbi:DNA-binding transcriptional activator of the SARP family [Lentzea xinjiangensis]|uniref:DNA-binding transcriptional activator of the SARP family n=1 Tax=Lentzea xinjiangensis TaxID=402600 RepID=A0A1H9P9K4_9PSEU|nr:BTAD domain-containing putative transcriptional regulator [Lentzea xinjiangensis]SER44509.1 DNA-binding transcriptional activator of the SARP family [Lentzea xinjiangensis]
MEVRILGPVEPSVPPKPAQILAVLAVECGRVVPVERLIDLIWGEQPPPQARKSLQVHISTLRRAGLPVEHRAAGYVLNAAPEDVDLHVFRRLVARAGDEPDLRARAEALTEALRLWRGTPVVFAQTLDVQRLAAAEALVDAELALGRHAEIVEKLGAYVAEYPLAERLRGQLMTALARAGRRADAMRVFRETRKVLVDELGVEPGEQLQQLHRDVLEGARDSRRNYLPRDAGDFTGRDAELSRLLDSDGGVWWIEGPAGVGKSALAVHAAHRLADRYPDGQLFVDLHSPSGALDAVLRAMDVPSERIPEPAEERAALWRATVGGRRVVIVLDGVTSVSQVRPLLPGSPGCLTLITSRSRLCGLEGVRRIPLDVLSSDEAVTLLQRILGDERVANEPGQAAEVARLCGYLPLAVRITGARLAGRAHWPVSKLVKRLSSERSRLDELVADDLAVRSSLELTYRALDENVRRAYRAFGFLGLSEVPSFLWGHLLDEDALDQLVDARLLDVIGSARYRMHELVRLHARELAEAEDPPADREDVVRRAVVAALSTVDGLTEHLFLAVPRMQDSLGVVPTVARPADKDAWFAREEPLLTKLVERAAELGLAEVACQLAEVLVFAWFGLRNRYEAWERSHTAALEAVWRKGNLRLEAVLRCSLGQMHYKRDNLVEARSWFETAQTLFVNIGDKHGEAVAMNGIGMVCRELGEYPSALRALGRARELLESDDPEGVAHALYGIGSIQRDLGDDAGAFETLAGAEAGYRAARSRRGEALAARGIGLVHRARGELDLAEEHLVRAHEMVTGTGDELLGCYTAQALAKVLLRKGSLDRAERLLRQAMDGCRDVGDRFGEALVRRTLGEWRLVAGDHAGAGVLLTEAVTSWTDLGLPLWRARTLRDLGAVHACQGDAAGADRCWDEATRLFTRLGTREAGEARQWPAQWGLAVS